jgi:hypothetical protein
VGLSASASADALANAARQLQYALEDSAITTEEAFQKLHAMAEGRQRTALQQLQNLLRSPESDASTSRDPKLSSYPALAWLLRQTTAPDRAAAVLFAEFQRQQSFGATSAVVIWSEFAAFLAYLGMVLALLVIVVAMYGLFVVPQFTILYGGLNEQLPALTALLFGRGPHIFTFAILLAAAMLMFISWFVFYLRRQLRRYAPAAAGYQKVPVVGKVAVAYNQYLWLSYAGLLRAAHMPAEQALSVAGSRLDRGVSSGLTADLSIAARLGKLEEECRFQQDATAEAFLQALARFRRHSRMFLTAIIYFLVALFVSGMYLPIFSLGSAI